MQQLRGLGDCLLTREVELRYAEAWRNGDEVGRERLISSCLPLVVNVARKWFTNDNVRNMDVIQEGNIGLMHAVDKFKPWEFKTRLSTYATIWIRQAIQRHLAKERGGVIHLPVHAGKGLPEEDYAYHSTTCLLEVGTYSVDFPLSSSREGSTIADLLPDTRVLSKAEQQAKDLYDSQLAHVFDLLPGLEGRDRYVLLARLAGGDENTLRAIARRLGLSRERVRQIEIQAEESLLALHKIQPWNPNERPVNVMEHTHDLPDGLLSSSKIDPLELLDQITPQQIEVQIVENNRVLSAAKDAHKRRAAYLRRLRDIVGSREGVRFADKEKAPKLGSQPSTEIIASFLVGKGTVSEHVIIKGTGLTKMQVLISLRKNRKRFQEDDKRNWRLQ